MPTRKGKKPRFSAKEDRQASHIAASERKRGVSAKAAKSIGYATVNKQKASGSASARNTKHPKAPARKPQNRRVRNKGRS